MPRAPPAASATVAEVFPLIFTGKVIWKQVGNRDGLRSYPDSSPVSSPPPPPGAPPNVTFAVSEYLNGQASR